MKTLAVIGGIGPESTIEYYRAILFAYRAVHGESEAPSIVINSIDVKRLLALAGAGDLAGLTNYLVSELERLAGTGASLGLLAANTPHVVFDEVSRESPIPLLSIVEAACDEAQRRGLHRLALLGTRFTMQGLFYAEVFSRRGLDIVVPVQEEQAFVHEKYTNELLESVFSPRTRDGVLRVIDRVRERDNIDGVILGGTELPLLLRAADHDGLPLLDTTSIHAAAAVARLWP
jgi:aspartate racemase